MELPLVSVIIPNYNNARFISSTIESVLSQDFEKVEAIVVDDGSTDNSVAVLNSFGNRVTVIRQVNRGVSAARNVGIRASKGEILAFLDADDLWEPEKLSKQVNKLVDDAEMGLVHCAVEDIDETGRSIAIHHDGLEGWVASDLLRYRRPVILGGGSAAIIRRDVIATVGLFDEKLQIGEDWEFYYRVARRYKVGFVDEPLVKYRRHSNNSYAGNAKAVALMRDNLLTAYDQIFSEDKELAPIRNVCYGRIHSVIAASFFHSGMYASFMRHALLSLRYSPNNLLNFIGFPFRKIRRQSVAH